MRVAEVQIENFRGIRSGRLRFRDHNVLVGINNSGKTTVLEALALLFGRDRLVRTLTEHDFYGSDPQPTDRIRLMATIHGFERQDFLDYPDWFRDGRAVPKWLDPLTGEVHAARNRPTWELACQIGFAARFDRPSLEVETARYFHDDDTVADVFAEETWNAVPISLLREIGFFLVPANRTWDRIISFGSELFRKVVASGTGPPADAVILERDRLRNPSHALEADPNLAALINELNSELSGFFQARPNLNLRLTSTDSDSVLDAVMPHYRHSAEMPGLPARREGSGLISLQGLLLLLHFGKQRAASGEGFWMALEEPELHLPAALQRRLVQRLQALSSQTFVTTHSPMVATMSDPRAVSIIRNSQGNLDSTPLHDAPLSSAAPNSIRKLFQLNRLDTISAIMHDVVLVPEGRIDFDWLRLLARAVDARQVWSLDQDCRLGTHVGLIPTHDGAVVATHQALSRLHPKTACVVDGDQAGLGYINELLALGSPPYIIVRWPDDWTTENVVVWAAEADANSVLSALSTALADPPSDTAELVARLKSTDRSSQGLKGDQIAAEALADALASVEASSNRIRELLNALTDTLLERQVPLFGATDIPAVKVFRP